MGKLTIPETPQHAPVPRGWAEAEILPVVSQADWDDLEEIEAKVKAVASYIESLNGDALEFELAKRMIEARKGALLAAPRGSHRHRDADEPPPRTATAYRNIAAAWDEIWPILAQAKRWQDVTQRAVLRLIRAIRSDNGTRPDPKPDWVEDEEPVDPKREAEAAIREAESLRERVRLLAKDDVRKALAELHEQYGLLLQQHRYESQRREKAEGTATYYQGILREVRAKLKAKSNKEVLEWATSR